MAPIKPLGLWEVLWMMLPVAATLGLVGWLKLGQGRRVAIATVRAVVQLLAVGLIIGWVFGQNTWYWVSGLLAVMTLVAGLTAGSQLGGMFSRLSGVMTLVLGAVTAVALVYLTQVVIGVHGWQARYLVPLGGMLLGNAMTASVLAVERLTSELAGERSGVEVYLALGASPWQAMRPAVRRALTAALTPTINAMMLVGIVKLPGMMTGQMLGGSDPFQAAMYQLLILVGILFGDLMAASLSVMILRRHWFTPAWQLNRPALRRGVR